MEKMLTYKTPTDDWFNSLPIGNGRLAAMVTNSPNEDILWLNHEDLWYRFKKRLDRTVLVGDRLNEVRRLIFNGKLLEATYLGNPDYVGAGYYSHINEYSPGAINDYKPAGNLRISFSDAGEFIRRELRLFDGFSSVTRGNSQGVFFASSEDADLLCVHYEGDLSCRISLDRTEEAGTQVITSYSGTDARLSARTHCGLCFEVHAKIVTDGKVTVKENSTDITGAKKLTVYLTVRPDPAAKSDLILQKNYEDLFKTHTKIFSGLMDRMYMQLSGSESNLPTDERVRVIKNGGSDPGLVCLYLHYGRYLLLSSSLLGKLPANLQGKWNRDILPPWNSDYHLDINLQMNYWMAESGNIPEAMNAFFDFFDKFRRVNTDAGLETLGCHGLQIPVTMDNEGQYNFAMGGWGIFTGTASWIAAHYYKHYEYSGDRGFLSERAYPFFKEIARFWEDYLVKDNDGIYQIVPSASPENSCIPGCDIWSTLGKSCAMDVQLCYGLLGYCISSAKILGVDEDSVCRWEEIRSHLPDFAIGSDGRLLEWDKEYPEPEPGHRHYSHLYGAFPGELFTSETRKEQWEACRRSLEYRLAHAGGHTGWSRAWTACLYARMGDADSFLMHMNRLITDFSTESLLDLHPPKIFQIDGNLGGAEAILQSLIQSRDKKIFLLYALPGQWDTGEANGLRAVGGHTLDLLWKDGKPTRIGLTVGYGKEGTLVLPGGREIPFRGEVGQYLEFIL